VIIMNVIGTTTDGRKAKLEFKEKDDTWEGYYCVDDKCELALKGKFKLDETYMKLFAGRVFMEEQGEGDWDLVVEDG